MKHIFLACALFGSIFATAQTVVYHENFETPDSVVATGNPVWNTDATLQVSGTKSHRNTVAVSDTSWLTTTAFNTTGNSFVILNFKQICKIEFFDFARIEVSNDNGNTWTMLTGAQYQGTSPFGAQGNKFTAASYAVWQAAVNNAAPNNTWWQSEQFDVSALIGNAAQAKIRFKLYDGNANGANTNYGWNIDDVIVTASASELVPPVITLLPPNLIGTVFNLGPYTVNADITDASGIASATLSYTVNNGPVQQVTMNNVTANQWQGIIPAVTDSDTVCFSIHAIDASPAANFADYPTSGCQQFVAMSGITFPYVENFDGSSASLWTVDDSLPGSPATTWQLGTPAYGTTNSAHSSPNSYDINLATAYGDQAFTYLISPVFDFSSAVNTKLSFWQNYNAEQGWDGVRVEYTTDGQTWNVLGTQNDPLGVNWYTSAALNSSGLPGWEGNSGGWIQSEYELTVLNNVVGPVQFRFVFTSDFSVTVDGYSIDDFSLVLPSPQDGGVRAMLAPDISSCLPTGSVPLTVVWKNFGTQNIVGPMDIVYVLDNNAPVVEQYAGTLVPAALDTFTFATPMNLSAGAHTLKVYTSLTGDGFLPNDSITVSFTSVNGVAVPYYNNLNTTVQFNDFCATNTAQGRVQALAAAANTGAMGVVFDATNSIGWNNWTDTIPSSQFYVWNSNVNPQQRANARLVVNSTGYTTLVLEFDAKLLYAFANEYTNFRVKVNGQQITPHMMPNNATGTYDTYRFMLDSFLPSSYLTIDFESKVAFDYVTGSGIFIDNVNIYEPDPFDAGVNAILAPGTRTTANANSTVTVRFRNYGSTTLTSVPLNYSINAGPAVTGTWTGSLAPNASTTYTFATPYSSPTGQYDICAWSSLNNDTRLMNDTTCKQVIGVPVVTAPYFEDFEGTSAQYWATETTFPNSWQLGNPSAPNIAGTVSGTNAWEINLFGIYDNNADEYLYTPFIDFSQVTSAEIRFWNWWHAEPSWDGGRVEMSTDGGNTWTTLGIMNDPNGTNWYNMASLISSGQPGWQGTGTAYVHSQLKLPQLNNFPTPVQFRFVFNSDASVNNYDGWGIDDFEIYVPINDSVTHIMVNSNQGSPMPLPGSNTVSVNMTNIGALNINTLKATIEVDGVPFVTENITFSPTFQPGQTRTYAFTTPWIGNPGDHQFRVWTFDPNNVRDVDPLNDTTSRKVTIVDTVAHLLSFPYCVDFENWETTKPWAAMNAVNFSDEHSAFMMGTPNKSAINTSASFTNSWFVGPQDSFYLPNDSSGLFTPIFNVVNDGGCYQIGFSTFYKSELGHDGGIVEFSTNKGANWNVLGAAFEPQWYSYPYSTALGGLVGTPSFTGTGNGWGVATHLIQFQNNGTVNFRFRFASDSIVQSDGWALDAFCFAKLPAPCYVGVSEIGDYGVVLEQNIPNPASNSTTIGYNLPSNGRTVFVIRNTLGQIVYKQEGEEASGKHRLDIGLDNFADGLYSYTLIFNDKAVLTRTMTVNH